MEQFADFALALVYPPNPNRNLDNSLTSSQANGAALFNGPRRMRVRQKRTTHLDSRKARLAKSVIDCRHLMGFMERVDSQRLKG